MQPPHSLSATIISHSCTEGRKLSRSRSADAADNIYCSLLLVLPADEQGKKISRTDMKSQKKCLPAIISVLYPTTEN